VIKGEIDVSDLLRWGKALEGMPKKVKSAAARALNTYGDGVVTAAVRYLSNQTGLDASAIREKIEVKRATASNLSWEMDASAVVLETTDWSRPWEGRDDSNFDKSALVKIIAHEDCCEVCAEAAEDSPYTMEQVQQLAAKWTHFVPPHPVSGPRTNLIHPNAVLSGTSFVSYGQTKEIVAAKFSGRAVLIRTATTGVQGTPIGPNHPMLTRRGFVKASDLAEGDELVYDARCKFFGQSEINSENVPLVQNAFESLRASFSCSRATASRNDLHGDAMFCEPEVHVVEPTRDLLLVLDTRGIEKFSEFSFVGANMKSMFKSGDRSCNLNFVGVSRSSASTMSSAGACQAFIGSHSLIFDELLLGGRAPGDVGLSQDTIDYSATNFEPFRQCQDALARFVKLDDWFVWDRVLSVHDVPFEGAAFDASTSSQLYNNGGWVVHNCRCAVQPWSSMRKMPLTFGARGEMPPELLTMGQLGKQVAAELEVELKVKF
jgi:hypothetical protein